MLHMSLRYLIKSVGREVESIDGRRMYLPIGIAGWDLHLPQIYCVKEMGLAPVVTVVIADIDVVV
jgi:hypothetical protein